VPLKLELRQRLFGFVLGSLLLPFLASWWRSEGEFHGLLQLFLEYYSVY
jgi:hypothetical protein